jgi:NADP-dependent 3-hydroxy acid dehydrogenase YdfG
VTEEGGICVAKVIVITGASSGIGAALARQLGTHGYDLVLAARRERELKQAAKEASVSAIPVVTDVRRRQDVERLRDAALQAFGHVDVWINNAGRGIGRKVLELTDEDFDEMMSVNVKAALYGMQAILPHFLQRGEGHLINVSSFLGRVPMATYRSAYNAAKSALNVLTANLRMDLRATYPRIHVSLVMPGFVATDFARNALWGTPAAPSGGRSAQFQSPEQVAAAIASLIEQPKPELYTNPALAEIVRRYHQDVGAFEESLAP